MVAGSWHLASVLGACLAELGHEVVGCDQDALAIAALANGRAPADEAGLGELLRAQLAAGRLRYTTDWREALRSAELAFVAHDTPVRDDDSPDLTIVGRTVSAIARNASGPLALVVSSQVPVGTTRGMRQLARTERAELPWEIAYVPEFLQLGQALERFRDPDRVVIGAERSEIADLIRSLYPPDVRVFSTAIETAEMIKHASNAFLATSISFMNEIAEICEKTGADAVAVAEAMRLDRRIGPHAFLSPGLGFAGGTLGRDVRALQGLGAASGKRTPLLDAVASINASRLGMLLGRVREVAGDRERPVACLLGLTYKAGTSTLRRSISLELAQTLLAEGWRVRAHDPAADGTWSAELPHGLELYSDALEAANGAHVTVLLTDWPEYRELDLIRLRGAMTGDWLIDGRNAIDPPTAVNAGLRYWGVGRGPLAPALA